jgi:competence protein ComEC
MRWSFGNDRSNRYFTRPVYLIAILLVISIFILLSGCSTDSNRFDTIPSPTLKTEVTPTDNNTSKENNSANADDKPQELVTTEESVLDGQLEIAFVDVGQADSILISQGQYHMLIDAGNNADADLVVNYLKNKGISKLNYVIGTHAHEDHIGGLDAVINKFNIEKILMPKQANTTKTFEDVLVAIKNKDMKVTTPKVGDTYDLGKAKWTILAPKKEKYEDINNSSIVIRITFGNNSFLFMGDAEQLSEQEILSSNLEVKSDLIKIGHHGSTSSTTAQFLKKVSPQYAVISVGKDNSYGHPDNLILNRLKTFGVEVYRTDEVGTIIATSDGNVIKFDKKASAIKEQAPPVKNETAKAEPTTAANSPEKSQTKEITVYITSSGKKYHSDGCQYLKKSKTAISLESAKNRGYTPCSKCNPPK